MTLTSSMQTYFWIISDSPLLVQSENVENAIVQPYTAWGLFKPTVCPLHVKRAEAKVDLNTMICIRAAMSDHHYYTVPSVVCVVQQRWARVQAAATAICITCLIMKHQKHLLFPI